MSQDVQPIEPGVSLNSCLLDQINQIASCTVLSELLDRLLELCCRTTKAEYGLCYLPDLTTNTIAVEATWGIEARERLLGIQFGFEEGLAGECFQAKQPFIFKSINQDIFMKVELNALYRLALLNVATVPLVVSGEVVCVVQCYNYHESDLANLQLTLNLLAPHVQKLSLLQASQDRAHRLEGLVGMLHAINSTYEQESILTTIIEGAKQLLNAEASSLFLVDESSGDLVLKISSSQEGVSPKNLRVPAGKGIIGYVVETGESVIVADAKKDQRHYNQADDVTHFVTRSILAVPLRTRSIQLGARRGATEERIIGGLEALNKRKGTFASDDASLLQMFADLAATVLQKAHLWNEANELYLDVIRAFSAAIDAKDPYTQGHMERVATNSAAIAEELGLDPETIHHLRVGALLHDVGKLNVGDAILKKAGPLTPDEYEVMKGHPLRGEEILRKVHQLQTETSAILQHHERLDGKGYPNGLNDGEISLVGRIVAVADAFDAMTSDRPYRKHLTNEEAFQRLLAECGISYDEECVHALFRAYKKKAITFQH